MFERSLRTFSVVKEMLKDNLIFGKGIRSLGYCVEENWGPYPINIKSVQHIHNYYLQSLSAGLIAFLLLVTIF